MTNKDINNNTSSQEESPSKTALFKALASLNSIEEINNFLTDLCTPQEISAFQERWEIAQLLSAQKLSYREISSKTGASTTTVSRVARFLNNEPHGGYRAVIEKQNH